MTNGCTDYNDYFVRDMKAVVCLADTWKRDMLNSLKLTTDFQPKEAGVVGIASVTSRDALGLSGVLTKNGISRCQSIMLRVKYVISHG